MQKSNLNHKYSSDSRLVFATDGNTNKIHWNIEPENLLKFCDDASCFAKLFGFLF